MIKKLNFIQTPYDYDCGRLHLIIKANTETKTIHVLDFFSPTSILNCREVTQPRILAQLHFQGEPIEWNWIWYASNSKTFMLPAGTEGTEGPDSPIDANCKTIDSEMIALSKQLSEMGVWEMQ